MSVRKVIVWGERQEEEGMSDRPLFVRGYIDQHPIYGQDRNWCTEVHVGDTLIAAARGFGSQCLQYGHRYKVIEHDGKICLSGENSQLIDAWNTRNTMPFFVKLRE